MAQIAVKTQELVSCAERLKDLSAELKDYAGAIDQVLNSLSTLEERSMQKVQKSVAGMSEVLLGRAIHLEIMSSQLRSIVSLYNTTEEKNVTDLAENRVSLPESQALSSETGGLPIFDNSPKGRYGGDQGNLANKHNGIKLPWGWVWFEDKDVYNYIKTHEGYEDYTEAQIHDLLNKMNQEGCGYIGIANAIFSEFEGSEKEFEQQFGFPMRDKNGNYNYNYMFMDLYCTTDNKYFLDSPEGVSALAIEMMCSYEDDKDAFHQKYGVELGFYDEEKKFQFSDEAYLAIINDINATYDADETVTFDASRDGMTVSAQENRIYKYLQDKGIDPQNVTYVSTNTMDAAAIQNDLDNGKFVQVLLLAETKMYRNEGFPSTLDGGHYVTITGVADDGRYIVSSWGEKYYIDPGQAKISTYQTIDLELKRE